MAVRYNREVRDVLLLCDHVSKNEEREVKILTEPSVEQVIMGCFVHCRVIVKSGEFVVKTTT